MSKWVTVLTAGFITACLMVVSVVPFFSREPFRAVYLVFWALTLASAWWLVKVIRTPSVPEPQPEPLMNDPNTDQPSGGGMILGCVLGVFIWAFIWAGIVAPLFGLQGLPVKGHLIFIIGIPAIAIWIFDKLKTPS